MFNSTRGCFNTWIFKNVYLALKKKKSILISLKTNIDGTC